MTCDISIFTYFLSSELDTKDDMWKFLAEAYVLEENDYNQRKIVTNVFTKQLYLNHYKVIE